MSLSIALFALGVAGNLPATAVTIEPVVLSIGAERDAVPGREGAFVFRGESDVERPTISSSGEVAFRARSSSALDPNTDTAVGIYLFSAGSLTVLADTTLDTVGAPSFAVPGQDVAARFIDFDAPLINDAGDVVFLGRFFDPVTGAGSGLFAARTDGAGLAAVVRTGDLVPSGGGAEFSGFAFGSTATEGQTLAALNDAGAVVFRGTFGGAADHGLYASSVTGAAPVLLADSTRTLVPLNWTLGSSPRGIAEIRPEFTLNGSGTVVFHGSVSISQTSNLLRQGVFVSTVGGATPDTVAYEFQAAPGGTTFSGFSAVDVNAGGTILIRASTTSNTESGLYLVDQVGNAPQVVVDSLGGFAVPGDDGTARFDDIFMAPLTDAGQIPFLARLDSSVSTNLQGVYLTDGSGTSSGLVLDSTETAPGLAAPARVTDFVGFTGTTATINEAGNVAFAAKGLDDTQAGNLGLYFFDACSGAVTRLVDSTTATDDLGRSFSTSGTQTRQLTLYQGASTVAGYFNSLTDDDRIAFLAQFDNFDFGIYLATVESGGGSGGLSITCPDDALALVCPADTGPAANGTAEAEDACSSAPVPVDFTDTVEAGCGATERITRRWSASDGAGTEVSCDQVLSVVDDIAPELACPSELVLSGGPDGVVADFSVDATDACDAEVAATTDPPSGSVFDRGSTPVTATAVDACGNTNTCTFDVLVSCFAVHKAKIGVKDARCKGIALLEVTSEVDGEQLVAMYLPAEGHEKLSSQTELSDGVNTAQSIHTSCSQSIDVGDVFEAYTVTDIVKLFDDEDEPRGNRLEFRGSFAPGYAIDLETEDVVFTVDDGQGTLMSFEVPAGSFEVDGKPEKEKFKFKSPSDSPVKIDARLELGRCQFKFKVKNVPGTTDLAGTAITLGLAIGAAEGYETVVMEDKRNHLQYKQSSPAECCPRCDGIAYLQVTSDQGVIAFEPDPGKIKLSSNTTVDDGVNGDVTIHTSCSQPLDVGDVFGAYTVSELVKVLED